MIPGEYLLESDAIDINAGRRQATLAVTNTGDRPIQVGSHCHFFEVNRALRFDRAAACRGEVSRSAIYSRPMRRLDARAFDRRVVAASLLLALLLNGCDRDSSGPKAEPARERGDDEVRLSWSVRQPPLFPYDPNPKSAPNSQRRRWAAPMEQWITVSAARLASAADCDRNRHEQYVREYGRRAASMSLWLDALDHSPDPSEIAVLHRRAAEDSAGLIEFYEADRSGS